MSNYYIPDHQEPIFGEQILILLANEFNDIEFFYPYYRFIEEGYHITVAGLTKSENVGKNHLKFTSEKQIEEIDPDQYDLLYIPGGYAPNHLRKDPYVQKIVRSFHQKKKPIVSICHGPLVLLDAGVLQNKSITCWPEIKDELINAGVNYQNQVFVRDNNLLTSRWPGDLPVFMRETLKLLKSTIK